MGSHNALKPCADNRCTRVFRVPSYIDMFRELMWPDDVWCKEWPEKTDAEKAEIREQALQLLRDQFPGAFAWVRPRGISKIWLQRVLLIFGGAIALTHRCADCVTRLS